MQFFKKLSIWFAIRSLITLLLFQITLMIINGIFIFSPLLKSSADDLAAIIVLSAKTWVELPTQTIEAFQAELLLHHNLWIEEIELSQQDITNRQPYLPYMFFLEKALTKRFEMPITIKTNRENGNRWYWIDIYLANKSLRISFSKERIGVQLLPAILSFIFIQLVMSIIVGFWLAQVLTKPLQEIIQAAKKIGQGEYPKPITEQGPYEFALLARSFNQMSQQIQDALQNRTVLLAGISHDLRTPLARLRLQIELLKEDKNPETRLLKMENDIEIINNLVQEFLLLAKGIQQPKKEEKDIIQALNTILRPYPQVTTHFFATKYILVIDTWILQRVIVNLIENALRYGDAPIELFCNGKEIHILDHGEGMPEDKIQEVFQPFVRLNNQKTFSSGSGLGLTIVKQLCQAHNWKISLENKENAGILVTIVL